MTRTGREPATIHTAAYMAYGARRTTHCATGDDKMYEEWAVPGGTARPGQPVEKSEQAPASSPQFKNQFNIDGPQWGPYQILS